MRILLTFLLLVTACDDDSARPSARMPAGGAAGDPGSGEGEGEGEGEAGAEGEGEGEGEGDGAAGQADGGEGAGPGEGEGEGEGATGGSGVGEGEGEGGVGGAGVGEGEAGEGEAGEAGEGEGGEQAGEGEGGDGEGEGEAGGAGGAGGGPPDDDVYEENDVQGAAAALQPGIYELVMARDDEDWFSVEVCANGRLTVVTDSDDFGGELDMAVHGADGAERVADEGAGNEGVVRIRTQAAETLYVRTWGFSGRANDRYTLRIDVDCGLSSDDGFEDNDSFEDAAPIQVGLHAALALPEDEDWYSFSACDRGSLTLTLAFEDLLSDLDLKLKDPDNRVIREVMTRNDREVIEYRFLEDMTAYVLVENDGRWENDYTLDIELDCP